MRIEPDFSTARANSGGRTSFDLDGEPPKKPPRDLKRTFLIVGLGALSWVATYVGMLELIEANMGDLPIVHRVIIGFSVAMLMTMIIWLLDQMFKPQPFVTRLFYVFGYVFLSLISIGFGFGFYWKVLESRGESSRSAESAVSQVQNSLQGASTRLEQLQATLIQLTAVSNEKAELERAKGTSCPNSKPGDGPRRKMREDDAQRFTFASEFVKGRVGAVKGEMSALDGDLAKIVTADATTIDAKTGTRNEFMKALGRKLDMTVTGFNAFRTDPQLRQIRADLAERAEKSTITDGKGASIACPDPQLQMALRGVVKAIDQLPELTKPEIAAVEGSEATIEAFRRLTTTFYGALAFKLPPSADELRELQKKAIQSVEEGASQRQAEITAGQGGLSKRDYVPLAVALFVDLCLFLVSMVQRPAGRLDGLVPKMQAAERGPVIQILSRFNDIHKDRQIRENFEIFRHVVFDMNGDYYVAVPLDAPPRLNPHEREALRVEAQLLSNLFASFEKEKIFKRTMLPVTSSIKKRLARQGSKFAGADAFRVYKFTDGAWSDIILGAVMGAARRAETTRRDSATTIVTEPVRSETVGEAPVAGLDQPANDTLASVLTTPRSGPRRSQPMMAAAPSLAQSMTHAVTEPMPQRSVPAEPDHTSRFGPYAQTYQPVPMPQRYSNAPQAPRVPRPAPPPLPEAEVTVKAAANGNAAPAHTSVEPSNAGVVVDLPWVQSSAPSAVQASAQTSDATEHSPMVDITLRRETATFSVPVSQANVPEGLRQALARVQPVAPLAVTAPAHDPYALEPERAMDLDDHLDDLPHEDFTAHDLALIGRMAPPAAE